MGCSHLSGDSTGGRTSWQLHSIVLAQFVRHTRRNPQKSPANPVPEPEKIIKERKTSQKGASGSGKPKQSYASLQERIVTEHIHIENIASSTSSEENFSEIHKAPYSLGTPLDFNPKETSPPVHYIPLTLPMISQLPTFQTANTLSSTPVMAGPQAPTKMERIIAARYGPLVLPTPLNAMPVGDIRSTCLSSLGQNES